MHAQKPASVSGEGSTNQKETRLSNAQSLVPRIVKELPSPKLFSKQRMRKLSQNGNQKQYIWLSVQANWSNKIRMGFLASLNMASLGSLYEMQTLGPHSGLLSQNLHFRKILR